MKSHRRFSSPENPVNFYKLIVSEDTRSTGIRIPKKFTKKHGKDLLEKVTLKVPNGDVWKVDLQKSEGEIWLKNGWWEFAEYYGIQFGHVLMFNYEGFSVFGVVIFSADASEIEYHESTDEARNSVKEDSRKCPVSSDEILTVMSEDDTSLSWSEGEEYGFKINDGGECSRKREIKQQEDGRRALEKAKANFKCDRPSCMVYMHKSYLEEIGMVVPVDFRRILLDGHKSHRNYLLLMYKDGKQKLWEVIAHNAYLGRAEWLMFVEENGIKVGDICVLELIHKHQNVLDVTILRS